MKVYSTRYSFAKIFLETDASLYQTTPPDISTLLTTQHKDHVRIFICHQFDKTKSSTTIFLDTEIKNGHPNHSIKVIYLWKSWLITFKILVYCIQQMVTELQHLVIFINHPPNAALSIQILSKFEGGTTK